MDTGFSEEEVKNLLIVLKNDLFSIQSKITFLQQELDNRTFDLNHTKKTLDNFLAKEEAVTKMIKLLEAGFRATR
jgi:predicted DNA binding CopG/RHH family protein